MEDNNKPQTLGPEMEELVTVDKLPSIESRPMSQEKIDALNQSFVNWEEERQRQEQEAAEKHKEDYIRRFINPDKPLELCDLPNIIRKIAEELYRLEQTKAERTVYLR